jgi:hypothetical protein
VTTEPENPEELRERARERMADMPAETALGNADPEGGGHGTPKEYEEEEERDK